MATLRVATIAVHKHSMVELAMFFKVVSKTGFPQKSDNTIP